MSLPHSYINEIRALDREIAKQQPGDILQFCANFFQRRLESQRAEFLLGQRHSSQPGMAESNFPGSNPFGNTAGAGAASAAGAGGMHSVAEEEEEHELQSPTGSSFQFPPTARDTSPNMTNSNTNPSSSGGGMFGNFGGFSSSTGTRSSPPPAASAGAMDQSQSFPNNYNMNRRTSVSAESLAPASGDDANWKAPNYPKTEQQVSRLRDAVAHNFLFSHLDDEQSDQVLGALQERKVPAKDVRVIVQGDAGDYFYVVEQGEFDIYVSKTGKVEAGADGLGNKVATNGPGTSFGELALMYNAPRAATVVSTEPSVLWQLDRITFRRILMDSAFQRRRMYESFLEEVKLFKGLTAYERSKIADALETVKYPANTAIIKEGDVGDRFFILESGEAEATKRGESKRLTTYGKGDYFGELALLEDKPRAASVTSTTEVKVATLGKDGFQRLLGPVESIMRRDDPRKKTDS
jgi:cAMP-dependent protein kinase regulator